MSETERRLREDAALHRYQILMLAVAWVVVAAIWRFGVAWLLAAWKWAAGLAVVAATAWVALEMWRERKARKGRHKESQ